MFSLSFIGWSVIQWFAFNRFLPSNFKLPLTIHPLRIWQRLMQNNITEIFFLLNTKTFLPLALSIWYEIISNCMTSSYACAVYIVCNAGHFNHDFITPGKSIYISYLRIFKISVGNIIKIEKKNLQIHKGKNGISIANSYQSHSTFNMLWNNEGWFWLWRNCDLQPRRKRFGICK